jgi:macrolide-specific efflux system membrane fusion protein
VAAGFLFLRNGPTAAAVAPPGEYATMSDRVAANGVVEGARPEVALRPEVAGTIAAIPYRENQKVAAGTILVELENSTQKHQLALSEAELAVARAERDANQALYRQADKACKRAQQLLQTKAVSQEQFDAAYYHKLQVKAQAEAAEGRLHMAEARRDLAGVALAKTRLRAPTAGHVLRVHAEVGELAGPTSAQPVLLFADLSKRRVRAFIEELDAARVRPGQKATITCDGLPGKKFQGTVSAVLPRMGKRTLMTDAAEEYHDVYVREVLIDVEVGEDLLLNLQVRVKIRA